MAFNARWILEALSNEQGIGVEELLGQFRDDLAEMIKTCPVYVLGVTDNGNRFTLVNAKGEGHKPNSESGLYAIFTKSSVIYFGEARNLLRRQLYDPDNTAASNKEFSNQGRAILKLLMHRTWADSLGLLPLLMQIYPESIRIERRDKKTFEECYSVSKYSKALEGAGSLFFNSLHPSMLERARQDSVI